MLFCSTGIFVRDYHGFPGKLKNFNVVIWSSARRHQNASVSINKKLISPNEQ